MPRPIDHAELFAALAQPFTQDEVKHRQQAGRTLSYITARTAMNRLDDVVGPANWWDRYVPGENSVLCELTIRLPDGSTLTKSDAGGYAGMADSGDDDKSGYSDGFKRACVKFGIGRYLYRDGIPSFVHRYATGTDQDLNPQPEPAQPRQQPRPAAAQPAAQNGNGGHQKERHDWPAAQRPGHDAQPAAAPQGNGNRGNGGPPRSGKALFAWVKEMEQKHDVGLLRYLNGFMKLQEFGARMVDLDAEQVALVYEEGERKLAALATEAN